MEAKTPKPAAPAAAATKKQEKISNVKGIGSAFIVILVCAALAVCLFMFIMGDPANFSDNDPANGHPLNYMGTVYKGGIIVPILITLLFTVIVLFLPPRAKVLFPSSSLTSRKTSLPVRLTRLWAVARSRKVLWQP